MNNVSFEELKASVSWRDEFIFDSIVANIRRGGDFTIVDIKDVNGSMVIDDNISSVGGSSHMILLNNIESSKCITCDLLTRDNTFPINRVEHVISSELLITEPSTMINTVEGELTRYYNYIRNLR